uniref:Bet v I/Major latex protein domain-containing protein n=3 Tax=Glycine subgen. Soja TaxID=1462606 RepID=K7MBC9_SOYBN
MSGMKGFLNYCSCFPIVFIDWVCVLPKTNIGAFVCVLGELNFLFPKIMGIVTTESELVSAVAPARLYKTIALDYSNFFPKVLPNLVKSVEIIEGDGRPGAIKKFTIPEGYVNQKADVVDVNNYVYDYTIVEGNVLSDREDKMCNEYKLVVNLMEDASSRSHASTTPEAMLNS